MIYAPTLRSALYGPGLRALDRSFERFVQDAMPRPQCRPASVSATEQGWSLELDLPGVAREELSVSVDIHQVRIETQAGARRSFKATYEWSEALDADASSAKLENGVLTLQLVRKAPVVTARSLAID